jgi:hypothetical protein
MSCKSLSTAYYCDIMLTNIHINKYYNIFFHNYLGTKYGFLKVLNDKYFEKVGTKIVTLPVFKTNELWS